MDPKKEKAPKAEKKQQPKVKQFEVVKYALTAKAEGEKFAKLFDRENKSYAAVIAQALKAVKGPLTLPLLLAEVAPRVEKRDGKVNVEANLRWYLNDLKKRGLIRSLDEKVEARSQDEARGVEA
jgi:hypothetical protein